MHTVYYYNAESSYVDGVYWLNLNCYSRTSSLCHHHYFITVAGIVKIELPHKSSASLPVSNPIIHFEDLDKHDRGVLFDQMQDLTKEILLKFKKLQSKVYESLKTRCDHTSIILTLTKDDVMIFDSDDELIKARNMFEVFIAISPHCSYFNYDLLKLLVGVHGSAKDKADFEEYLQDFTSYCQAIPCAEEVCGNGGSGSKRTKLKFKTTFNRQRLKPDVLRNIKLNIAKHLRITSSALYLSSIKEGCLSMEFLIPSFLFERIFPLSDKQKTALYNEAKVTSIYCEEPNLFVVCVLQTPIIIVLIAIYSNIPSHPQAPPRFSYTINYIMKTYHIPSS